MAVKAPYKKTDREELESLISKRLLETFFYNKDVFAKQLADDDGNVFYNTVYNKIDATTIRHMLRNNKAIMAYQQTFQKLKWICLDFDISKPFLYDDYDYFEDTKYRVLLEEEVENTKNILEELKIHYTIEFSGNRGFHIWILLKEEVNKSLGHQLIEGLINKINFRYIGKDDSPITLDKYPKNGKSKGNSIGLGVKIPLSFHMKSNAYSYVLENVKEVKKVTNLSEDFLLKQLELISNIHQVDVYSLIEKLQLEKLPEQKEYDDIAGLVKNDSDLSAVICSLTKCEVYNYIFSKGLKNLNEFDRMVITGTLVRLGSSGNPHYGKDLLIEYFSTDKSVYNEDLTKQKINTLSNLYPPNLRYLENKYGIQCSYCNKNNINNVLELLQDIGIVVSDRNEDKNTLSWIINSEKKYLTQNDEVPLNFIYDELTQIKEEDLLEDLTSIKKGEYLDVESYRYLRKENEDKERILYSFSAKDRVLTTFAMFEINKILYGQYSSSSYSYRLNYEMSRNDIFINWNSLWLKYVKDIEGKIHSDSYDNYYILKLDISQFYEKIDQIILRDILYEQPSKLTSMLLADLSIDQKNEYKNICEYLINASQQLSNKGIPQGPAYARYLAEIYLTVLDESILSLLTTDFEHYFRYVDDMVLLIESKEKLEDILIEIKKCLATLGLKLNTSSEKFLKGKVSELKYQIIGQDLEKYFIDGVDEKSTPIKVVNKAVSMVDKMFREGMASENFKQLPFYLTHLISENYLALRKEEIVKEVTKSDIGRGSLFKHFYKNIVFSSTAEIDIGFFKKLTGLSRGNFINQLSRSYKEISLDKLEELVSYYLKENLAYYERIELIRLILRSGANVNHSYLLLSDYEIIVRLIDSTDNIKWTKELLKNTLIGLQREDDKSKALVILDSLLSNSVNLPAFNEVITTIYSTLSRHVDEVFNKNNLQLLNNLICFISMYLEEFEQIIGLWNNLNTKIDESVADIKYNDWLKYNSVVDKSKIVDNSVVHVLTSVFSSNGINPVIGVKNFEKEYAMYLFLYLFNSQENPNLKSEIRENIYQIINGKNLEFLRWCLGEGVEYFPSDDIAIQNIHLNDRVVLKKNNELLVRGSERMFSDFPKEVVLEEEWYKEKDYRYTIVELNTKVQNIYDKLKELDLFKALEFLIELKKSAEINEKYVNVFETGAFRVGSNELYLKYSKCDTNIVINGDRSVVNEKKSFLNELLTCFKQAEITKKELIIDYEITNHTFELDFLPSNIRSVETKMSFIESLVNNIQKYFKTDSENIYSLEIAKVITIREFLRKQELKNYKKELELLGMYNTLYNNDYEKYLLYGKTPINSDSLEELIKSLKTSLSINIEHDDVNFILKSFEKEEKLINESSTIKAFKHAQIETNIMKQKEIKINGKKFNTSDLKFYELFSNLEIKELTSKDVFHLGNSDYTYFSDDCIILIPQILTKVIDIIENKQGKYDKSSLQLKYNIENDDNFSNAVKNIQIQSGVSIYEAKRRVSSFLYDVNSKYIPAVLSVIASYLVMDDEVTNQFKNMIISNINEGNNKCLLPLKWKSDDNGLHQILFQKYKDSFDRNSDNDKRLWNDYKKINNNQTIDEIIFISDLGVSGSQFKKALNYYLDEDRKNKNIYLNIQAKKLREQLFVNKVSVTILNTMYSDVFEFEIIKFFYDIGYRGELNFKGSKFNYKDYLFKDVIKQKHRALFLEFLSEKYDLDSLTVFRGITYKNYLSDIEEDLVKNTLVGRYKSMPKFHHVGLTLGTSIFRYRKD
jgi:Reverse transcriptase (RNA-dependent DNA polymerase)